MQAPPSQWLSCLARQILPGLSCLSCTPPCSPKHSSVPGKLPRRSCQSGPCPTLPLQGTSAPAHATRQRSFRHGIEGPSESATGGKWCTIELLAGARLGCRSCLCIARTVPLAIPMCLPASDNLTSSRLGQVSALARLNAPLESTFSPCFIDQTIDAS